MSEPNLESPSIPPLDPPPSEADTLPPPMTEEAKAIASAVIAALRDVIVVVVQQEVGKLAVLTGQSQTAIAEQVDRALASARERDVVRANQFLAIHALVRKVADHVGLPHEQALELISNGAAGGE